MNTIPLLTVGVSCVLVGQLSAADTQAFIITADNESETPITSVSPAGDTGDTLRTVAGVSGVRMGGHGIDPVIRGQAEQRLSILFDNASVYGACPNRMDPSASFATLSTYDTVDVHVGVNDLQHGATCGSVSFSRNTQAMQADEALRGHAGLSYNGNGPSRHAFIDLTTGKDAWYVRGIASTTAADNYADGNGDSIVAAYESQTATLITGITLAEEWALEAEATVTQTQDALYAGAPMDAPIIDHVLYRAEGSWTPSSNESLRSLEWNIGHSSVDHLMDNYSLRTKTAPMFMETRATSDTLSADILGQFGEEVESLNLGLDYERNNQNAERYAGMMQTTLALQSLMWPDAVTETLGLFAEKYWELSPSLNIFTSARLDVVNYEARAWDQKPSAMSAKMLANTYYNSSSDSGTDNNLQALVRLEGKWGTDHEQDWHCSLSRTVRSANNTERYVSANNGNTAKRWVGNSELTAEAHHQIEAGLSYTQQEYSFSVTGFINSVSDYILRDRAHGQSGILLSDNATIYRNVDAQFYGTEIHGSVTVLEQLRFSASASYLSAENTTDSRAIAQTPPLTGQVDATWSADKWDAGISFRLAAAQTERDDDITTGSGLDADHSAPSALVDIHGSYDIAEQTVLRAGIKNLLNTTYSDFMNRANAQPELDNTQVNEPGLTFWADIDVRF